MKRHLAVTGLALLLASAAAARAELLPSDVTLDRSAALQAAHDVSLDRYPDADTVLVDDLMVHEVQPDGTAVFIDDTYVKVLSEKGRRELQDMSFDYRLPYTTVDVIRIEVLKPDGRTVAVDPATQAREMVDRSQMQDNIFDPNDKILQVGVPDLEVGDVLNYAFRIRTLKPRMPGTWADLEVFEATAPIRRAVYEVRCPSELPLVHRVVRDPVEGTVDATQEERGGRTVHRWVIRDVPRYFAEPDMPDEYSVVQRVLLSTIPDWQTVSRWYWNLSAPHLDAVTPEMRAAVLEVVGGAADDAEKVRRLFAFVAQKIRYMGITTETEAPGYEPHDVRTTFENRYGVCRDKAALLVAMLRIAGLKGFPVLIHAGPKKDPEVPQPFFNHAIVAAELVPGEYVLMDPTDENSKDLLPAYLCDKSYLVARSEGDVLRTSPIIPADSNLVRIASSGRLTGEGAMRLETDIAFEGANDNIYRNHLVRLAPEERKRFVEVRLASLVPGAKVESLEWLPADLRDLEQPLRARVAWEAPGCFVDGRDYRMLSLPWVGTAFGMVNFVLGRAGLETRRFPLRTDVACGLEEKIDLDLDGGSGEPLAMPRVPATRFDSVLFELSSDEASNRLVASSRFHLKAVEYDPEGYRLLKGVLKDVEYARRQRAVFRTQPPAAAENEAEILASESVIDIEDAHRWTLTDKRRMRILNYAGKKRLSELHFDYNPAWDEVRVERAVVTSPAGVVQEVAAAERNVMDAEWAGSAPRYPAAKTLVVSLPGVELGSVIDYTVVRRQWDRPFLGLNIPLRGFDPVQQASLRLTAPEDLAVVFNNHPAGEFVAPAREARDGRATWTHAVSNAAALVREGDLPPLFAFVPTVMFSTGDWPAYAGSVIRPMREAAAGNPEARALARKLAGAEEGAERKLAAVRDHVVRNVRLAGPGLGQLPLNVLTPADVTLREGYGNVRDRALLFYVMLEAAGFRPEFVLAAPSCPRVPALREAWMSCPQPDAFANVLVRVALDGTFVYLNDTDQYAQPGSTPHHGKAGLLESGEQIVIEAASDLRDRTEQDVALSVDASGDARVTFATRHYGMGHAAYKRQMVEQTPEERRRYFQERRTAVSQAAVPEGEPEVILDRYPSEERFSVLVPRFAVRTGDNLYFSLPQGLERALPVVPAERFNPLYRDGDETALWRVDLKLPSGRVEVEPEDFNACGPAGFGCVKSVAVPSGDGGGMRILREMDLNPAVVERHRYEELTDFVERARHPSRRAFLLRLDRETP